VCVAGTHGKTTTSTMIAWMLRQAGRDPTFLLGGESLDLGTNAAPGAGEEIVVEADEYARAFLEYAPQVAVLTNVEADHLEYYGSVHAYEDAFRQFMRRVRPDGVIIVCRDSPRLAVLAAEPYSARIERYGLVPAGAADSAADLDWLALDDGPGQLGGHDFSVLHDGKLYSRFSLRIPGAHMAANAAGAVAAGAALGLEPEGMRQALAGFRGARRRFEHVGEADGVTVVDDFAHHPTEVRATLTAARERFAGRRLVVIFQPHTYSRTSYLLDEFRNCFVYADHLFVLETYASRESPDAGVSAQELAEAVTAPPCEYVRTAEDAADRLQAELRSGDVLVTIGAGDIDRVGRAVLEGLRVT
jgi:UDP-N-acetylmuramate--alanine ligase